MNLLAFDYGDKRIGYAVASLVTKLALPSGNLLNEGNLKSELCVLVEMKEIEYIIVGFPLNLSGNFTLATEKAVNFANSVHKWTGKEVCLVDERMTTSLSYSFSRIAGENTKKAKKDIDARSAAEILNSYIQNPNMSLKLEKKGISKSNTELFIMNCESSAGTEEIDVYFNGGKHIIECLENSEKKWRVFELNPFYYSKLWRKDFPDSVISYKFSFSVPNNSFYCARSSTG